MNYRMAAEADFGDIEFRAHVESLGHLRETSRSDAAAIDVFGPIGVTGIPRDPRIPPRRASLLIEGMLPRPVAEISVVRRFPG